AGLTDRRNRDSGLALLGAVVDDDRIGNEELRFARGGEGDPEPETSNDAVLDVEGSAGPGGKSGLVACEAVGIDAAVEHQSGQAEAMAGPGLVENAGRARGIGPGSWPNRRLSRAVVRQADGLADQD